MITAIYSKKSLFKLRYYIIDLQALIFMFNLSQASASTVDPIDPEICMVNLHYIG